MSNQERRKNTRVAFHTTMDITFPNASFTDCPTENLSTKGVWVEDIPNRTLGDTCSITIYLKGSSENLSLTMNAEVMRVIDAGVGLHFTDIDIDSFSHLRRIIYYNCTDPDTIDEDFREKS